MTAAALEARDVTVRYGGLVAVDGVSMTVPDGALVGLIGPNGAGKTTFIDAVTGFAPARGTITLGGTRIDGWSAHRRARAGVTRTFQSLELFDELTVAENLRVHADPHGLGRRDPAPTTAGDPLAVLGLEWTAALRPTALPHGTRRLVSIARALAGRPTVLLLDEPAAGLEVAETRELARRLRALVDGGVASIVLVDHDMSLVMGVCDVVYVLDFGRCIATGPPAAVRADPAVVTAYLGGAA